MSLGNAVYSMMFSFSLNNSLSLLGENYVASECLCLDATLDVASEFTIE